MRYLAAALLALVPATCFAQYNAAAPIYAGNGPYSVPTGAISPSWHYANTVSPIVPVNVYGPSNQLLQRFPIRSDRNGTFAKAFSANLQKWCAKNAMVVERVQQGGDHFDVYVAPLYESSFGKVFVPVLVASESKKAATNSDSKKAADIEYVSNPTAEIGHLDRQIESLKAGPEANASDTPGRLAELQSRRKRVIFQIAKENHQRSPVPPLRLFTTGDRRFSLQARYVAKSGNRQSAYLETKDGSIFEIQLAQLQKTDQDWLNSQQ